jgi:hypothetical protein
MGHIFRPGLHACEVAGSLVFLDLPADRYFALSHALGNVCLRLCTGCDVSSADLPLIAQLLERDILQSAEGAVQPALCREAVSAGSAELDGIKPVASALVIGAFARHVFAGAELKFRRLDAILNGIAREKARLSPRHESTVEPTRVAAAFMATDRVITARGRCLSRSVAIARTMLALGIAPDLILGVKLRPFEAHCWVQHGNALISDDPGTIRPFTPILIL